MTGGKGGSDSEEGEEIELRTHQEKQQVDLEVQGVVENTEDKADDGSEQKDTDGMVELHAWPVFFVSAMLGDLHAHKPKGGDVEGDPESEEGAV